MHDPRERPWQNDPRLSEEQKASLDRLYDLWVANDRKPVLIESVDAPDTLKGLYLHIDTSQSPPLWRVSTDENTQALDEDA